jgi:hypothetical protein
MNHDEKVEVKLSELLSDRPIALRDLAINIRREITQSTGECSEILYKTYAVSVAYTYTRRLREAFLHMAVYANHLNLGFNQGTALPDPDGVLKGTGKLIRHIRIDSISTIRKPAVKNLVNAGIEQGYEMAEQSTGTLPSTIIDKTSWISLRDSTILR